MKKYENADFYVAVNGDDGASGTLSAPFQTIERAVLAVREARKTVEKAYTVCIMAGEYFVRGIEFTSEDGGTEECPVRYCVYGDGKVSVKGGISLKPEDFRPVNEEERARLRPEAADRIFCVDLKRYGIVPSELDAPRQSVGYKLSDKYDGVSEVNDYEVFFNGKRMIPARYPNQGEWLKICAVKNIGDTACYGLETESGGEPFAVDYEEKWNSLRNPDGGCFYMEKKDNERVKTWKNHKDIRVCGYFNYDWAYSSSIVKKFHTECRELYPAYASLYGYRQNAPYYFENVFEELDEPGEYYLDREQGILYLCPETDVAEGTVSISLSGGDIFHGNANHIIFEGLNLELTRGSGFRMTGNGNRICDCMLREIYDNAIILEGKDNEVANCEIAHVGKGGIVLRGGEREHLIPGNNRAENNYIHDFMEVERGYNPGVTLEGVGNVCAHNEICNAPHIAVWFSGNDHVMEYNYIHDVVQESRDAGAIYGGREWTWQGNIIRYNLLKDIGGMYEPVGIYLDDGICGESVYGNILVNAGRWGIEIGGGRDHTVYNNVVIGSTELAVWYDQRFRDVFYGGNEWMQSITLPVGEAELWQKLKAVPYQSEIWASKYPNLARVTMDPADLDSPDWPPNPANSKVYHNVFFHRDGTEKNTVMISKDVYRYSTVEENLFYPLEEAPEVKLSGWLFPEDSPVLEQIRDINIDVSEIGRRYEDSSES